MMTSPSLDIRALIPRIHTTPDLLARSSGQVSSRYGTPMAAVHALLQKLSLLPVPLLHTWLQASRGHVVINSRHHVYRAGAQPVGSRLLQDVAWIKLAYSLSDPILYFTPVGTLISQLIGWGKSESTAVLKNWKFFCQGVESCFRAGYGRSEAAREDIDSYVAEGIAAYLVDRRQFNIQDPAFEKLLRATVFQAGAYHHF